jgi:hypothetical protein
MPAHRPHLDRRTLMTASAAIGAGALVGAIAPGRASTSSNTRQILVDSRTLEVGGKPAKVFGVTVQGTEGGIFASEGERFLGTVHNATDEPLQMHWHGQTEAPFEQDRARPGGGMMERGRTDSHDFLLTPGTHWMHSHTLSEQQLLAAPMVTREKNAGDVQDVVIMLHDFAFRSPQEILAELGGTDVHAGHGASNTAPRAETRPPPAQGHAMHGMGHGMGPGMMHGSGAMHGMGGHAMGGHMGGHCP